MATRAVTQSRKIDNRRMNSTSSNTATNNSRTTRHGPYNAIGREYMKNQLPRTMRDIQFHDPDEQHWLELEQLENERSEQIPQIRRAAHALPGDHN